MDSWWLYLLMISSVACTTDEQTMISKYIRAYYIPGSGDSNTKFGQSVTSLGDVDGDGVVDIAVGTPFDGTSNDGSLVLMFLTTAGAWGGYSILYADDFGIPLNTNARLGYAVAKIDDANSDGVQDVAVSSIGQNDDSPFPEGAVHVATLSKDGEVKTTRTFNGSYVGAVDGSDYGRGIIAVGDWLGVGPSEQDLLIGAPGHGGMGCIFLLRPGNPEPDPPRLCADEVLSSEILSNPDHDDDFYDDDDLGSGMLFGHSLAYLGEKYIAVGSPGSGDGTGVVWLLELDEQLNITGGTRVDTSSLDISGSYPQFGSSITALSHSSSGDDDEGGLDGDSSTLDLAIGAEKNDGDALDSGAVYLLTLNPFTGEIQRSFKLEDFDGVRYYTGGSITNFLGKRDYFGSSITCLGDINNDGNIDITVGLPGYGKNIGNNRGGAWATLSLNPILGPSEPPTPRPSHSPAPTHVPSLHPTPHPSNTYKPTRLPSHDPTAQPSTTVHPTKAPTKFPTTPPTKTNTPAPSVVVATYQYSLTGSIGFAIVAWCCIISVLWTTTYAMYKFVKSRLMPSSQPEEPAPIRISHRPVTRLAHIPSLPFAESLCHAKALAEDPHQEETCSICLCEMEPKEMVKELQCSHCFHEACLDQWLRVQFVCPLCKRRPVAPSQPISELGSMQHYLDHMDIHEDLEDSSSLDSSEDEEFGEVERGIQLRRIYLPPPPSIAALPPPPLSPLATPRPSSPALRRPSLVFLPLEEDSKEDNSDSSGDEDVIEAVLLRTQGSLVAARRHLVITSPSAHPPRADPSSPEHSPRRVFSPDDDSAEITFIRRSDQRYDEVIL